MNEAQLQRRAQLNIDLTLDNAWQDTQFDGRVFLIKKKGESMHHVAMKFLSYALFYETDLEIERSVDQHYKPDLVVIDGAGRPTLWIDCGATSPKKLATIMKKNNGADFVIVKKTIFELERYIPLVENRIDMNRISFVSFEDDFVSELAGLLNKRHAINIRVLDESTMVIEIDDELHHVGLRLL